LIQVLFLEIAVSSKVLKGIYISKVIELPKHGAGRVAQLCQIRSLAMGVDYASPSMLKRDRSSKHRGLES
jgi:hypothetical protein